MSDKGAIANGQRTTDICKDTAAVAVVAATYGQIQIKRRVVNFGRAGERINATTIERLIVIERAVPDS